MQQLALGRTYRVTFKQEFIQHGVQDNTTEPPPEYLHEGKGVATIAAIMSFQDVLSQGINLYASFFEPCGISKEDYMKYYSDQGSDVVESDTEGEATPSTVFSTVNFSEYPIYKFVDVVNKEDVYYVPELAIASFPEVDINQYLKVALMVDLGIVAPAKADQVDVIKERIVEQVGIFGIKEAEVTATIYDTVWMSTPEFDEVDAQKKPEGAVRVDFRMYEQQWIVENAITSLYNGTYRPVVIPEEGTGQYDILMGHISRVTDFPEDKTIKMLWTNAPEGSPVYTCFIVLLSDGKNESYVLVKCTNASASETTTVYATWIVESGSAVIKQCLDDPKPSISINASTELDEFMNAIDPYLGGGWLVIQSTGGIVKLTASNAEALCRGQVVYLTKTTSMVTNNYYLLYQLSLQRIAELEAQLAATEELIGQLAANQK